MTAAARERLQVSMPIFFVSATAWIVLCFAPAHTGASSICQAKMQDAAPKNVLLAPGAPFSFIAYWALMLTAMMLPALIKPIRYIRDSSFTRRRVFAIALFLFGYAAIWIWVGIPLVMIAVTARAIAPGYVVLLIATTIVFLWEFSPAKQRCLNRCHADAPLDAFGFTANLSALRFGLVHGMWCVGSCWLLMLVPWLFSRGHVVAMAVVSTWIFAERLDAPRHPRWRWRMPAKALRIVFALARCNVARQGSFRSLSGPNLPGGLSCPESGL